MRLPVCFLSLLILPWASFGQVPPKPPAPKPAEAKPKITVVVYAILGTTRNKEIPEKLSEFAREAQKKDPKLTGFSIAHKQSLECSIGQPTDFKLVGNQKVTVTLNVDKDDQDRVTLTIKAPGMKEMTYACVCDRYLPIATDHLTPEKDRLFIAISSKRCTVEGK